MTDIAPAEQHLHDLRSVRMASLLACRRPVSCPAPRTRGAGAKAKPRVRGTAVAVAQEAASDASSASTAPSDDEGFTYERFQELLDKFDFKFKAGDKVTGNVLRIDNRGAYVDIGAKSAAFVPTHEVSIGSLTRVRFEARTKAIETKPIPCHAEKNARRGLARHASWSRRRWVDGEADVKTIAIAMRLPIVVFDLRRSTKS